MTVSTKPRAVEPMDQLVDNDPSKRYRIGTVIHVQSGFVRVKWPDGKITSVINSMIYFDTERRSVGYTWKAPLP